MGFYKSKIGLLWSLLLTVLIVILPKYYDLDIDSIQPLAPPSVEIPNAPKTPKTEVVEDTIRKNRTLVATLVDYDVPVTMANELADLIRPVFDVRKMRFGNPFRLEKEIDGTLTAFEYKIDEESVLKVHKGTDSYEAKVEKIDLDSHETTITAEIHNSLWEALSDVPKREYLATELSDIFQWQVDFSTEMQPGDQIRVVVDEFSHDGNFVKYGKIQAAELVNAGKHYRGFLFNDSYYDQKGVSLKRAILASPLKFTPRITSGFNYRRMHPILGHERAHLAADYGAPTGSPVVAIANGTVTFAGWSDSYGNLVRIKHASGLTSGYAHLSQIAAGVGSGKSIKQGELVGLVGQTGLATGPHLHFEMAQNGKPINPVPALKKGEPAPPLDGKLKGQFAEQIADVEAKLDVNSPALTAVRQ
jgi:murein DD-endopeptidase MepM/ murein hydrolase activator NlpD